MKDFPIIKEHISMYIEVDIIFLENKPTVNKLFQYPMVGRVCYRKRGEYLGTQWARDYDSRIKRGMIKG